VHRYLDVGQAAPAQRFPRSSPGPCPRPRPPHLLPGLRLPSFLDLLFTFASATPVWYFVTHYDDFHSFPLLFYTPQLEPQPFDTPVRSIIFIYVVARPVGCIVSPSFSIGLYTTEISLVILSFQFTFIRSLACHSHDTTHSLAAACGFTSSSLQHSPYDSTIHSPGNQSDLFVDSDRNLSTKQSFSDFGRATSFDISDLLFKVLDELSISPTFT
jgi:hypothetical protein